MTASDVVLEHQPAVMARPEPAAEARLRIAITSVFGDPLHPATWSGAPSNLATELVRLGAEVFSVYPRLRRHLALVGALQHLSIFGRLPLKGEAVMRTPFARSQRSLATAEATLRLPVDRVLHTGTFDLLAPVTDSGVRHYVYCDHTWDLALRHRRGRRFKPRGFLRIEEMEREAYAAARHIFSFSRYVRDNLIDHYGVPPDRVTAVGSGTGRIEPYDGPKDHAHGFLLFIAKHMFAEKGGHLAIKAFRLARRRRPDLRLTIVGNDRWRSLVGDEPGVHVLGHVPWDTLQELLRSASLLLQPMFNDPWGQVYLEALKSRTPVIGLARNGLPEITEDGRHGFLAKHADPVVLAELIVDAMADPERLSRMGASGQRHVLTHYSWEKVARAIADTIARE